MRPKKAGPKRQKVPTLGLALWKPASASTISKDDISRMKVLKEGSGMLRIWASGIPMLRDLYTMKIEIRLAKNTHSEPMNDHTPTLRLSWPRKLSPTW